MLCLGQIVTILALGRSYEMNVSWCFEQSEIDWIELSDLYRAAPLGVKSPNDLEFVFTQSRFKCFLSDEKTLIGAGRALADGRDCAYICDIAIHPEYQGMGLGKQIVQNLIEQSKGHKKIILYANPGKEGFYSKLGFKKMNTAMAIFQNEADMIQNGTLSV
jgi:ribosomal protein S18 acetylase RimI-like enzyme